LEAVGEVKSVRKVHGSILEQGLEVGQVSILIRVVHLAFAKWQELRRGHLVDLVALDPSYRCRFGDCDNVAVCCSRQSVISASLSVDHTKLQMNDSQYAWNVRDSVPTSDLAITESDIASRTVDHECRRVGRRRRGESVVRRRGVHVDIPEGKCRTHLGWRCETVLVFFYSPQRGGVLVSQQLGFQERLNGELRIAVAEAFQQLARAVHVKSTVASPCQG
jgi:hypothetical protein